ncbi:hypothetical protein ACJMK2_015574 [Sinanodonta woodiana]|uniref:Uncharacterized protein n=1 Tax=Sinanodonta woodiana TaxID=1069815 RepID=A0ABD3UQT2_SINWO
MFDFQEMKSLQMWLAGLCLDINATRTALDRVRRDHDEEILQWKSDVSDFLLLPSEALASETIIYRENAAQSEALNIPFAEDI